MDLLALLVLARLLNPADFGKVAIAMTLLYIVEALLEVPAMQAIIRAPEVRRSHLDTAFTLGLTRGIAVAVVMAVVAWPYALFNNDSHLVPLICALSLAPAVRGLVSPAMVHFARDINFKPDFLLDVTSKAVGLAAALIVAFVYQNYWALAASTIVTPITMVMASYVIAPYRPRLSLSEWPTFQNVIVWSTANQLPAAINWQIDRLLLGRYASRVDLGRYAVAGDLSSLPMQSVFVPLSRTLLVGFSAVLAEPDRLRGAFKKGVVALYILGAPIFVGMALVSESIVRIVLGAKWPDTHVLLSVFAIGQLAYVYNYAIASLAIALNKSEVNLFQSLATMLFKVPAVAIGLIHFGIPGLLLAYFASQVVQLVAGLWFSSRLLNTPVLELLMTPWRPLLAALAMAAALFPLLPLLADQPMGLAYFLLLASVVGVGAILYAGVLWSLWALNGRPQGGEEFIFDKATKIRSYLTRQV